MAVTEVMDALMAIVMGILTDVLGEENLYADEVFHDLFAQF